MCLAIPGQLIEISGNPEETFRTGRVSFDGVVKEVSLALVPEAKTGDYLLIHVGAAISVVDPDEARQTFDLLRQLGELDNLE